jgi:signal transduction histidine kinase/DNA-binding NarL/FixJ family response regulator
MKNFFLKISEWFLAPYEKTDIRIKKRATMFFWIQLANSIVYFFFIMSFFLNSSQIYYKMGITYIFFEAIYISSLFLLKTGNYRMTYTLYAISFLSLFTFYVMFIHLNKVYTSIYWITIVCILIQVQFSLFSLEKSRINLYIFIYSLIFVIFVFNYMKLVSLRLPIEDWERDEFVCLIFILFYYIVAYIANWITCSTLNEVYQKKNDLEKEVSERTNELINAKDEIELLYKQKTNFFVNLTHETKTPLTLINNHLDKYIRESGNKNNDLEIIKRNLDKITRDITNFFEIEKVNHGKIIFNNIEHICFSDILREKILLFDVITSKKKIKIINDIKDDIFINIDLIALDRLLSNLIENSIKFTDENGIIEIILRLNNQYAEFIISDNGIGISIEEQAHIFEPYYQVSSIKKNSQGIGLGLCIVKNIADQFNLTINLKSELKQGTKFIISFVPEINDTINHKKTILIEKPVDFSVPLIKSDIYKMGRNNILIVEDNIELLNFLSENISKKHNVFHAVNGNEALKKMEQIPKPDLILSDIMMDKMDGYEFYQELTKISCYKEIPFIYITARMTSDDRINGLLSGAVDYITKPFLIDELSAKIDSILNNKKAQVEFIKDSIHRYLYNIHDQGEKTSNYDKIEYKSTLFNISEKEKEVLQLLLNGLEYKEIGDELKISINTIRSHIKSIYVKCKVDSKYSLMKIFR